MIIDPPSGWRYGFPREYNPVQGQTLEDWLRSKGYPDWLNTESNRSSCRYWDTDEGD